MFAEDTKTCEERYDEIKRRESALKKGRRAIEDKMEAFKEATEVRARHSMMIRAKTSSSYWYGRPRLKPIPSKGT
jgi:hypothetical protein